MTLSDLTTELTALNMSNLLPRIGHKPFTLKSETLESKEEGQKKARLTLFSDGRQICMREIDIPIEASSSDGYNRLAESMTLEIFATGLTWMSP